MRFKDVSAGGVLCLEEPCSVRWGLRGASCGRGGGSRLCRESSRGRTWCGGPAQLSKQQVRGLSCTECLGAGASPGVCQSERAKRSAGHTCWSSLSIPRAADAPGPSQGLP